MHAEHQIGDRTDRPPKDVEHFPRLLDLALGVVQIVRRAVQHRAHAQRQLLDLVEHGVDFARQCIDLVVRIAHRQTLRQIAAHDLCRHR